MASCSGMLCFRTSDAVAICNSAVAFRNRPSYLDTFPLGSGLTPSTGPSHSWVASGHVARREDYNSRTNRIGDRTSSRNHTENRF